MISVIGVAEITVDTIRVSKPNVDSKDFQAEMDKQWSTLDKTTHSIGYPCLIYILTGIGEVI